MTATAASSANESIVIGRFPVDTNRYVYVTRNTWEGRESWQFRLYYKRKKTGDFAPSRTGVTIPIDQPLELRDLLTAWITAIDSEAGFSPTIEESGETDVDSLTRENALLRKRVAELEQREAEYAQTEAALTQFTRELERSNSDLEQFAYVASHDLQEPLKIVQRCMIELKDRYDGKLGRDADNFMAFAVDGTKQMQALIEGLLTYSRVGARGGDFLPTDSEAVIQRAIRNLTVSIEESDAKVTHDMLPTVLTDPVQLGRLFQNLISNAIKFRREDTPPRIHISAERAGDRWTFRLRDNGIGIRPKDAEKIFVIFHRLHGKTRYPGTGIGLAVCKRIVERHGGQIWVESGEGEGATFCVTLPGIV